MAWLVFDLIGTLLEDDGAGGHMPTEGAVEALTQFANEGHRLTVHSSVFAPMPESERQRIKEQLEQELASAGFPPIEIWTGTTKPDADLFIGKKDITYQDDWGLVLAQAQTMMEDYSMIAGPQPDNGVPSQDEPEQEGQEEEMPPEGNPQ
jgi:hypothetical protein